LADGWVIKLRDAYTRHPSLSIIGPHLAMDEEITSPDDPFHSEMRSIIQAVDGEEDAGKLVLSSFEDALSTYALTWKIRQSSEQK
jgi:hypothetical protein